MTKKRLIIIGALLALLIGGLAIVGFGLDPIVKGAVEYAGTEALGKPVTLESASLRPFSGLIALEGLVLPNADGFEEPEFLSTRKIEVLLSPTTLLSDPIRVSEINIDAPKVTLEVGREGSNLGAIKRKLEETAGKSEAKSPESGKKPIRLELDRVVIRQGTVVLAQSVLGTDRKEFVLDEFVIDDFHTKDGEKITTIPRLMQRIVVGILEQVARSNKKFPKEILDLLESHDLPALDEIQSRLQEAGKLLPKVPGDLKKGLEGLLPGGNKSGRDK